MSSFSVRNAQVDGMKDFKVIHATHPFIMKNKKAIEYTCAFLRVGKFEQKQQQLVPLHSAAFERLNFEKSLIP